MNKKGDLPSLSFLIGVLIAILIIVPLIVAFAKVMWFSADKDDCLGKLVSASSSGGIVVCPPAEKSVLVGFDSVQQYQLVSDDFDRVNFAFIERPKAQCVDGRACLCSYVKKGYVIKDLVLNECKELDGVSFVSGVPVAGDSISSDPGYDFFSAFSEKHVTFNVSREGDAVVFCGMSGCPIDKPKVVLEDLKILYRKCLTYGAGECSCGKLELDGLGRESIELSKDEPVVKAVLNRGGDYPELTFQTTAETQLGTGGLCFYNPSGKGFAEGGEYDDKPYFSSPESIKLESSSDVYLLKKDGKVCFSEEELYGGCFGEKVEEEVVPL
ncbi:MAG: hypothetical protein ABIB71_07175 [Candidatus Woesearchaeota archaeon]